MNDVIDMRELLKMAKCLTEKVLNVTLFAKRGEAWILDFEQAMKARTPFVSDGEMRKRGVADRDEPWMVSKGVNSLAWSRLRRVERDLKAGKMTKRVVNFQTQCIDAVHEARSLVRHMN